MLAVRRLSSPVRLFGCAAIAGSVVLGGVITSSGAANAATSTWHNGTTERAGLSKQSATQQAAGFARSVSKLGAHASSTNRPGFAPADAPVTTPTSITVTGTHDELSLDAVSTAAFVQFTVDGTNFGTPVAVTGGNAATTPFDSWGYSNGDHVFAAADCATAALPDCNLPATVTQTVALDNSAPVMTAPADGSTISGALSLTATSSGGGVQFLIDGTPVGFVGSAPYTFVYVGAPLTVGSHTVTAVQCSTDGLQCNGPGSAPITVKMPPDALHPSITTISPSTFSPNKDGVKDSTKITYDLPSTEKVSIRFTNSHGTLVRGPINLGTQGTGAHSYTWNGHGTGSSKAVASGTYTVTINTSATVSGFPVTGSASKHVIVDDHAPVASKISALKTFYPHKDGYRDTFPVSLKVNEHAAVTLSIRTTKNKAVRSISTTAVAGTVKLTWNGHDSHGHAVKSGAYHWYLTLKDTVGNHTKGATHKITVSSKKLVSTSKTITKNADTFFAAGGTDSVGCTMGSLVNSRYSHGLLLTNNCTPDNDPQPDFALAYYRITVPTAVSYSHLTLEVGGAATSPPTGIGSGFGVGGGTATFGDGGNHVITTKTAGYYTIGSISAGKYVSGGHHVVVGIDVDPFSGPCGFDFATVRLKVTYKVLK
jgi:flagellar hook assembly protein FlgD